MTTGRERKSSVLSFISEPADDVHAGFVRRQLNVDGVPLEDLLPVEPSGSATPVFENATFPATGVAFLRNLLGAVTDDLREGRIALGYCGLCGDSSCGILLAADLVTADDRVSWRRIGVETEHFGTYEPDGSMVPPVEWWTPSPFEPELRFEFDADHYRRVIAAEIARLENRT